MNTTAIEAPKRRVRKKWEMRWARTYAELQTAPWSTVWAYDETNAKDEMNRIAERNGFPYGQSRKVNGTEGKI